MDTDSRSCSCLHCHECDSKFVDDVLDLVEEELVHNPSGDVLQSVYEARAIIEKWRKAAEKK